MPVPANDQVIEVDSDNGLAGLVDDRPKMRRARLQGGLQGAHVGDVPGDTDHPRGCAVRPAQDLAGIAQITGLAVAAADPKGRLEFRPIGERGVQLGDEAVPVVGVQHLPQHPGFRLHAPVQAIELEHPIIPDQEVLGGVPVPDAHLGRFDRQRHPLAGDAPTRFGFGRFQLGPLARGDVDHRAEHAADHALGVDFAGAASFDPADLAVGAHQTRRRVLPAHARLQGRAQAQV